MSNRIKRVCITPFPRARNALLAEEGYAAQMSRNVGFADRPFLKDKGALPQLTVFAKNPIHVWAARTSYSPRLSR